MTFRAAARAVPAYANLLRHLGVKVARVRSYREFLRRVPLTDARHYADMYSTSDRCAAHVADGGVVGVESPRGTLVVADRAERARLRRELHHVLTFLVDARRRPTLAVILHSDSIALCLARFADALRRLADDRRLCLSVAGPLSDLRAAELLLARDAPLDGHVLLIGSPAALETAAPLAPHASVLSIGNDVPPEWSARMSSRLHIDRPLRFGGRQIMRCLIDTADAWPIAWDSPLTMLASELAARDERLCRSLFDSGTPRPIAQFDPLGAWIETAHGRLCMTRFGTEPRVRFVTAAHGTAVSSPDINARLKDHGYDASKLLRALGWPPGVRYPMPVVRLDAAPTEPSRRPAAETRATQSRPEPVKPIVANYIR